MYSCNKTIVGLGIISLTGQVIFSYEVRSYEVSTNECESSTGLGAFLLFFPLFFWESPGRVKKVIRSDFLGNFQTEYHKYNGFNNCLSFIRRFLPHNWVCACSHAFIVCWFEKSRPCLFRTNLVNSACVRLNRCMQPPISFPYPSGYRPISIQRKGQGLP